MISENVEKIRTFKGLSRSQLAEKAGLSEVTIWKIEKGNSDPGASTLEKLAAAMEISVELFFAEKLNFSQKIERAL